MKTDGNKRTIFLVVIAIIGILIGLLLDKNGRLPKKGT
jgi:uncharacterized membrane protein